MAKTKERAGKRALAAGRDRLRVRKSAAPKAAKFGSRKPGPAKAAARKQKTAPASESARLKQQLKAARLQQQASANEAREALERQTATAEILKVIASSPSDVRPIFEAITDRALRLCEAAFGGMWLTDGDKVSVAAAGNVPDRLAELLMREPMPLSEVFGRNTERPFLHIVDAAATSAYRRRVPITVAMVELGGARTLLCVPLGKDGRIVGIINLYREEVRPFSDREIALVQSFADQAVIAIENARLFKETQEALERQTATAEVLQVISSSIGNVTPVFERILESAGRLIALRHGGIFFVDENDILHCAAASGPNAADIKANYPRPVAETSAMVGIAARRQVCFTSVLNDPGVSESLRRLAATGTGDFSIAMTPLLWQGNAIGMMNVTREAGLTFNEKELSLLRTFADQAVIAIQNARLFDQVQTKTRNLEESLQQQTATANVLKVISRAAFDLDAVMQTLARSAAELCAAPLCGLYIREGDFLVCRGYTAISKEQEEFVRQARIAVADTKYVVSQVLSSGKIANIGDFATDRTVAMRAFQQALGFKALLIVPLMREGYGIGLFVLGRDRVGEFSPRHIELVQTFADQAVIAIENVRLFDEVQAKTQDLEESLQQQIATADVLKVISRSTFDLQPVLDTLVSTAAQICDAEMALVFLRDGEAYRMASAIGVMAEYERHMQTRRLVPGRGTTIGRAVLEGGVIHIADIADDPEYQMKETVTLGKVRTSLAVPLLREGNPVGVFTLARREVRPFTDKQIELVTTFADQAVIAIQNVRLFEEVQTRNRELAASLVELRTAQGRLVQTEKLASLGQLTAGIAHEIKNPLNFVNNFSALSAELVDEMTDVFQNTKLDEVSRRKELDEIRDLLKGNLEKIVQHGKRADSIVKNMLLHSREGSGEMRVAEINGLVEESLNLAYHGARAEKSGFNITLQREFDASAGSADLFPQEITRALLNLISNGFYAATRRKAENGEMSFEPMLLASTRDLGGSVEIRIRDNGTGIPPEVKDRMFNPFFTTKPTGEGTGLGLSMTHDIIVKQHGGSIDVETELGAFTEFRITLPRGNGGGVCSEPE